MRGKYSNLHAIMAMAVVILLRLGIHFQLNDEFAPLKTNLFECFFFHFRWQKPK